MKKNFAASRALSGLLCTTLIAGGLAVSTAASAIAQDATCAAEVTARTAIGEGTLSTPEANVAPGGVVTITGTGFDQRPADGGFLGIKLNQNKLDWPKDQSAGDGFAFDDDVATTLHMPGELIKNGNFEVHLVLPDDLADGRYLVTFLGGNDGGSQTSKFVWITVNGGANDGHCNTIVERGDTTNATQATAQATAVKTVAADGRAGKAGDVSVTVDVTGFPAGETLAAKVGDTEIAASGSTPAKVAEDGTATATFVLPAGTVRAGTSTLQVVSATAQATAAFTSQAAGSLADTAAGARTTFTASNLPVGAKVTAVGTKDNNWLTSSQATTESGGKAVIDNIAIPTGAEFGSAISFSYDVGGTSTTVDTGAMVNASNAAVAVDDYEVKQLKVTSGLYQSAVNDKGEVFVTRAQRTANSTLYKLDGSTLEILAENNTLAADGDAVFAAYGIGLDNTRGLVWVTNTRQNTVAVYKQDDLSLVAQFDTGEAVHSRDVVVDESTGKAYVSAVYNNTIDVFDLSVSTTKRAGQIDVSALGNPMSLEFVADKGAIYTTALDQPRAAKIDVATGKVTVFELPAADVVTASGIAYDPEHNYLFIASQGTGNTVVADADTGAFVAEIPTGASALNARYNPVDKRVYITNRGGGTVTVIDPATLKVVANLPAGKYANHVSVGPDGTVYAVNKAAEPNAAGENEDTITSFKLKESAAPAPNEQSDEGSASSSSEDSASAGILGVLKKVLGVAGILAALAGVAGYLANAGIIPADWLKF